MSGTVLIADDTAFMRAFLRDLMQSNGYEVVAEAANGLEAVQMFKTYRPDVVTMDLTMPIMDGLMALKEIRSVDPTAKVIICSAMGNQQMVVEAVQAGARDFMVKPFHRERLLESLRLLLQD
ncbi:response regulator [Cohnella nanjingensis]|uniref:Response regulator n=1 Tax=Cohnella nanjingensis TaxID=1387779 RepID=A0A7X0RLU6_9BACL|nr:response regulator [Cohnella nanjingensis]MBB6669842.1 response regulator [Cohnella nanjingensis]